MNKNNKIRFATQRSGIVIIAAGFIFFVITGLLLFNEPDVDDSTAKGLVKKEKNLLWRPLVGLAVMAFGSYAYLIALNRK